MKNYAVGFLLCIASFGTAMAPTPLRASLIEAKGNTLFSRYVEQENTLANRKTLTYVDASGNSKNIWEWKNFEEKSGPPAIGRGQYWLLNENRSRALLVTQSEEGIAKDDTESIAKYRGFKKVKNNILLMNKNGEKIFSMVITERDIRLNQSGNGISLFWSVRLNADDSEENYLGSANSSIRILGQNGELLFYTEGPCIDVNGSNRGSAFVSKRFISPEANYVAYLDEDWNGQIRQGNYIIVRNLRNQDATVKFSYNLLERYGSIHGNFKVSDFAGIGDDGKLIYFIRGKKDKSNNFLGVWIRHFLDPKTGLVTFENQ